MKINTESADLQSIDPSSIHKFAHDVRTPLSVIVTGLEALKAVRADGEIFDEVIRVMKTEGADRICKLLDELTSLTTKDNSTPPHQTE